MLGTPLVTLSRTLTLKTTALTYIRACEGCHKMDLKIQLRHLFTHCRLANERNLKTHTHSLWIVFKICVIEILRHVYTKTHDTMTQHLLVPKVVLVQPAVF